MFVSLSPFDVALRHGTFMFRVFLPLAALRLWVSSPTRVRRSFRPTSVLFSRDRLLALFDFLLRTAPISVLLLRRL
jgi:hypothetical protein